jgi:hypothetical protein
MQQSVRLLRTLPGVQTSHALAALPIHVHAIHVHACALAVVHADGSAAKRQAAEEAAKARKNKERLQAMFSKAAGAAGRTGHTTWQRRGSIMPAGPQQRHSLRVPPYVHLADYATVCNRQYVPQQRVPFLVSSSPTGPRPSILIILIQSSSQCISSSPFLSPDPPLL